MKRSVLPVGLGVIAVVLYTLWLAWPITIITADIGRHIADGRVFFEYPQWRNALLHTNFYSVSNSEYAIVNHHWLSGLLFYLVQVAVGWKGLHLFAMMLCIGTLLLMVRIAADLSTKTIALSVAILLLPMIAYRLEIRPEFFGYLCMGLIYSLLTQRKYLFAVPLIIVFWVNVHASFPIGLGLIGLFTLDAIVRKLPDDKYLLAVLIVSITGTLVNPSGLTGALYPFMILQDPGYAVLENQSIHFLNGIGLHRAAFTFLQATSVILFLSCIMLGRKKKLMDVWMHCAIATLVVLMAWLAVRHITMAGFMLIPVFSYATFIRTASMNKKCIQKAGLVFLAASVLWQGYFLSHRWLVLGLEPKANAAAAFIKNHHIDGPLFNNFDVGGYAIYHLFPDVKPFVYNRPESYPSTFWREEYIPMMQDNTVWQRELAKYNFNTILLYYGDRTTWAQDFLKARLKDPEWEPVFVDKNNIIFLRNTEKNLSLIRDAGIPRDKFVVR